MDPLQHFWEKVYQDNAPKLIGICRRYVANRELAEDLVHDAFISAINKHSTYNGRGSLGGWLRTIVINTALMHLRKEKKNSISRFSADDEMDRDTTDMPDEDDIRSLIENAGFSDDYLLQAIDGLPEHHKIVFNLYVMDNYTHKQIASELNISEGTSKSHLARARKKLQKILYQKIMADKEKRKPRVALLIPFTAKANYIDRVFSSRLSGLQIRPVRDQQVLFSAVNWKLMTKPALFKKQVLFSTLQTAKYVILPALMLLTAVCTVKLVFPGNKKNMHPPEKAAIISQPITCNPDTLFPGDTANTISKKSKSGVDTAVTKKPLSVAEPEPSEKQPVVVKKTIIQRQTVEVQKTVHIYDTTDVR
ncbi:MAG: sigma-70 family RNA polymerase sigma factor [Prolixibacteraceae bacterium]|nr:sigma-70 family RNA polymerase sigma factor [Prolixibacteraceae bacterium]